MNPKTTKTSQSVANVFGLVSLLVFFGVNVGWGQINMSSTSSHTQDFNGLANSGTGNAWTDNSTIANWYSQRTGSGTSYDADAGSGTSGNLYSYGTGTNVDRALGTIGSGNAAAGSFAHGVLLRNTSGAAITSISISYTLEQWRNSAASAQSITFYYKTSSSTITNLNPNSNGTWTQVTGLTLSSPVTGGTAGALTGNNAANKVSVSSVSIPSLSLANNDYIMLKWEDPDHTGTDHGLSIDDVTISWTVSSCTAPTIQASATSLGSPSSSGLTASWTAGNGNGTMAVIRPTASSLVAPVSGTSYTASLTYGSGGTTGTNNYVVFRAAGTTAAITGLSAQTQYTVTTYEYNTTSNCYNLTSPISATAYTLSADMAAHAASFTATPTSQTTIDLSFTAASSITNADGYIVLQKAGSSAPISNPSNATSYSAGNTIGDATVAAVINSTSATTQVVSGLTANSQYSFKLIPFNWDGTNAGTYNYFTGGTIPTASATTLAITAPVISSPTSASISNTTATLGANVTSDGGATVSARGIVWSINATNNNPTIGGTGVTQVAGTGTTGVYTVNATGLPAGTLIAYRGYATNSQGTSYTTATTFTTLENASKLAFGTAPPTSGTVNTNLTSFTVLAQRSDNSTDNTYIGTITITKISGSGNLAGTISASAVAGVATFSAVQFDATDSYVINATASGLTATANSSSITINAVSSNATDNFRTAQNGAWSATSTWESFTGGNWVAATLTPTNTAGTITIQNTHTVTVTSNVTADQLTVNNGGSLLISGALLTINDGTGTDLTNNSTGTVQILGTGSMRMNGTISNSGTFSIAQNGIYAHNNPTPDLETNFTWSPFSILSITGWDYSSSNGGNTFFSSSVSYGSIVWDSPTASGTNKPNFVGNLRSINGDLWIKTTSTQDIRIFGSSTNNVTCTITGNLIISGGTLQISNGNPSNVGLLVLGNYSQTGGTLSTINSGGSNSSFINFGGSNGFLSQSAGSIAPTSATLNLAINSNAYYTLTTNIAFTSPTVFTNNGSLAFGTNVISGSGAFTHANGATILTANANGVTGSSASTGSVQMSGTETYATGANYIFNGSSTQNTGFRGTGAINTPQLTNNIGNLIINTSNTVTQDGDITLNGTLSVPSFATYSAPSTVNINKGTSGIVSVAGIFQTGDNNGFSAASGASLQGFSGASDIILGSNSIVQYNGASQTITNQIPYQNLLLSSSGTLSPAGNYSVLINHSITGGTLSAGASTINVGGDWYNSNQGNFSEGTSTVNWNGTATQSILCPGGENFYQLVVSGTGSLNLANSVSVGTSGNGGLLISNGVLDAGTNTLNNSPNAPLQMTGGLLRLAKTGTTLPEFTNTSAYNLTGGTLELYGSGNVTLRGSVGYNNLLFSNNGIATITSGISSILGTVSITGTTTLDGLSSTFGSSATNLFMNGNALFRMAGTGTKPDMDGTYSLSGNSKLEFYNNGATAQTVRTQKIYSNVDITGSNVGQSSGNLTISGGSFRVLPGASYSMTNQRIRGTGNFTILEGATFWFGCYTGLPADDNNGLTSAAGLGPIQVSGTKTFSPNAFYGFQGGSSCAPALQTGDLFPRTVAGLYMSKTGVPVSLTNDLVINGLLSVTGGTFDQSGKNVTLLGLFGASGSGLGWTTSTGSGLYISSASGAVLNLPSFVNTIAGYVQIERAAGVQLSGPLSISASVMMTAGGFNLNGSTLTLAGSTIADNSTIIGTGSVFSNAYFRTTNANGFSGTNATIPTAPVTLGNNSVVEFASIGAATLAGYNISPTSHLFSNVIASGGGLKTLPSSFSINSNGYFNITSDCEVDGGANSYTFSPNVTVSIAGMFSTSNPNGLTGSSGQAFAATNAPTIVLPSSSTINYYADVAQSVTGGSLLYQNIQFLGLGKKNFPSVLNIQGNITNGMTATSAGFGFGTSIVSLSGANLQIISNTGINSFYNLHINKTLQPVSIAGASNINQIIGICNIQNGPATTLYTNDKLALISYSTGAISAAVSGSLLDFSTTGPTNGSVDGKVIVQRSFGTTADNRAYFLSMPVTGNLDQMQSASTNFFFYNETKTAGVNTNGSRSQLWDNISSPSGTGNTVGRAYSMRFRTNNVDGVNRTLWPSGNLYNGSISLAVTNSGQFNTSTLNGWNLLGNPYPSPVNLNLLTLSNIDGNSFYVWQGDKYGVWNATLGTGINGVTNTIGVMQGFFVRATGSGSVGFTNAARTSGQNDNLNFYRVGGGSLPLITLNLTKGSDKDQTKLVMHPSATSPYLWNDKADAYKLAGNANKIGFYTLKENRPTSIYTFDTVSSSITIPLGITLPLDTTVTFVMEAIENMDPQTEVTLEDRTTQNYQPLALGAYSVSLPRGTYENRFYLTIRKAAITQTNGTEYRGKINIFSNGKSLKIVNSGLPLDGANVLKIYDVSGKLIWNIVVQVPSGILEIGIDEWPTGIYLFELNGTQVQERGRVNRQLD